MATQVQIGGGPGTAKVRHPVAVPALSFVTLGIYYVYWWYQVNREMVDLGKAREAGGLGDNPTLSLLAVFPGALVIVPPFFTLYNGVLRMQRAQEVAVGSVTLNGWIVLALIVAAFFTGAAAFVVPGYIQSEMNKVWETQGAIGPGKQVTEIPQPAAPPAGTSGETPP